MNLDVYIMYKCKIVFYLTVSCYMYESIFIKYKMYKTENAN